MTHDMFSVRPFTEICTSCVYVHNKITHAELSAQRMYNNGKALQNIGAYK